MDGSHPEEKSVFSVTDPTPKRNLIFQSQISPLREIWSKSPESHLKENLGRENRKARDPEVSHQTAPPPTTTTTTTTTTLTVLRPDGFAAGKIGTKILLFLIFC